MSRVLGVDPGASGALAIVETWPAPRVLDIMDMPMVSFGKLKIVDGRAVVLWASMRGIDRIMFENVHSRPGQGVTSVCSFCGAIGGVLASLRVLGLPMRGVTPNDWKRVAGLIGQEKPASIGAARLKFGASIEPFLAGKSPHADRAEAALIAIHS